MGTKLVTTKNLAAYAAQLLPSVDVDGRIVAAHDTDTEREAFVPSRLAAAQLLTDFVPRPVGGTDGQALVKSGTAVAWGTVTGSSAAAVKAPLGWISPRSVVAATGLSVPTVTVETAAPYANALAYDSPLVSHPAGRYELLNQGGIDTLINTVNAPAAYNLQEMTHEFATAEAGIAVRVYVPGSGTFRLFVEGQFVYSGSIAFPAGIRWIKLVFPTAVRRTIRLETYGAYYAGLSYATGAEVTPPVTRRPRAVMYGDSYVGGAGGLAYYDLHPPKIAEGLGWEVSRMGHGGSGYVADDPSAASQPLTDATRLAAVAAQTPDWIIVQGSVNDDAVPVATVQAAAASVYSTLATSTPRSKLVVVGVQPIPGQSGNATRIARNNAIKAAAAAAPNVVRFLDAIGEQWLTDADTGLMLDGTHLTAAGHTVWANKLITSLVRA